MNLYQIIFINENINSYSNMRENLLLSHQVKDYKEFPLNSLNKLQSEKINKIPKKVIENQISNNLKNQGFILPSRMKLNKLNSETSKNLANIKNINMNFIDKKREMLVSNGKSNASDSAKLKEKVKGKFLSTLDYIVKEENNKEKIEKNINKFQDYWQNNYNNSNNNSSDTKQLHSDIVEDIQEVNDITKLKNNISIVKREKVKDENDLLRSVKLV